MCACVRTTRLTVCPRCLTAAANGSHCERTMSVSTIVSPSSSAITPAFDTPDSPPGWSHTHTPSASSCSVRVGTVVTPVTVVRWPGTVPGVSTTPARSVDEVLERLAASDGVFDSLGEFGDPIDILAHSLQCAYELEQLAPDDTELQIAGLVHDLGHVLGDFHTVDHGEVGGAWVEPLLGARVARLTVLHVPAKRYLVATDADYAAELSDGSALSLELQGGAMTADEAKAFAADPHGPDAATLRRADEAAKVIDREVPGLDHWAPVVQAVADARATAR